jgi:hypothetical protein
VGVGLFVVAFGTVATFVFTNKNLVLIKLYCATERHIEHRNWETALALCDRYLELTEHDEVKERHYQWMTDNAKFALSQTGRLLDDFFSYSKYLGFGILFPQMVEMPDRSHPGIYNFLSAIGVQADAVHANFEQVIIGYEGPLTLVNLIKSHLICGDYKPAVEFVTRLEQSLFFKKQAKEFRQFLNDPSLLETDSFYVQNRRILPRTDFQVGWKIDDDAFNIHLSNPDNQRAFEYALTVELSNKQYLNYPPYFDDFLIKFNYTRIPRHLEEVLIFSLGYGLNPEVDRALIQDLKFGGLKISEKTIDRYDDFLNALGKHQMGMFSFQNMQNRFGDTYWFHVLFVTLKPIEIRGQPTYDI